MHAAMADTFGADGTVGFIEEEGPFACAHCGKTHWAHAAAQGPRGSGLELIRLAACPACGERDPRATAAFKRTTWLRAGGALGISAAVAAAVIATWLASGLLYYKILLLSGAGPFLFFGILHQRAHALRSVDRLVDFQPAASHRR